MCEIRQHQLVIPKSPGISVLEHHLATDEQRSQLRVLADLSTLLNPFNETGDKAFGVVDD